MSSSQELFCVVEITKILSLNIYLSDKFIYKRFRTFPRWSDRKWKYKNYEVVETHC